MNILIADDVEPDREWMASVLRRMGHVVFTVTNGHDAITLVKQHQPDLIILDVVMPRLTGLGFLHEGRKDGWLKCPVIILTGFQAADLVDVKPVVKVLTKPIDESELCAAVDLVGNGDKHA